MFFNKRPRNELVLFMVAVRYFCPKPYLSKIAIIDFSFEGVDRREKLCVT